MRAIIISFLLLNSLFFSARAQSYNAPMTAPLGAAKTTIKVPPGVVAGLKSDFPKAADVYWELEYDSTYTAAFIDTTVINVNYSQSGKRISVQNLLTVKQVPSPINEDIAKRYKGWIVVSARLIIDDKGSRTYTTQIQKSGVNNSYELTYGSEGNFISASPPLPKALN